MKHFYGFRLDTTNHCLWRGDERLSLTPKAFDLLRYLVEHRDRLVSHDEILDALWPDTHVNQEVVKKYVLGIRKVLDDSHDQPQFIRTFPKRGYQFVAPVTDDRQPALGPQVSGEWRVIDRPSARAQLEACLARAGEGSRQVVFVTGEAGLGKTTFVDGFLRQIGGASDTRIVRGQCIESFGSQEPYYAVLEAIDQLVRRSHDARLVDILRTQAPTWLLQFPALVKADQLDALRRDAFGVTRERMVREACELFETIANDRPLIVVLEDLHWADPATLDVVSTLARRRQPARVMLVVTQRPPAGASSPAERLRQDLEIRGLSERIALEPFVHEEISEFLALEFGGHGYITDLAAVIHRQSGGNALFVSALVRDLVTTGSVVRDRDEWKLVAPIGSLEPRVPQSLQDMLNVQFDQLSAAEQRALKAASVIGERFPAWLIAVESGDLAEVERSCEELAERGAFIRSAGIDELANGEMSGHYEFRHALYRQAIYGRLSEVARVRLHRAAGQRLEALHGQQPHAAAAEVAMHFEKAREHQRAIRYLMLAAGNAAHRFAVRDSLEVLQHARSLVPELPLTARATIEIQILEQIGDAQYALGNMVEAALAYETEGAIAARAGLSAAQVHAQCCFARALGLVDPDRALAVLRAAEIASEALGDPIMQARTQLLAAGTRLMYDGWTTEDAAICTRAHGELVRAGAMPAASFEGMIYAHVQALQGDADAALRAATGAGPDSIHTTSVIVHLFALSAQVLALLQVGRFGDALAIARHGQDIARKNGSDPWLLQYREAWLRTLAMDYAGAQRVCDELTQSNVFPTGQASAIRGLAAGFEALHAGRPEAACRSFKTVCDPTHIGKFWLHWYWRMHARIGLTRACLQADDLSTARREAARLTDAAQVLADPNLRALAWETKARVDIAAANWAEATLSVERAFDALKDMQSPVSGWQVHATATELHHRVGRFDRAAAERAAAHARVMALADSLPPGEPMRDALLDDVAMRRIRDVAPSP